MDDLISLVKEATRAEEVWEERRFVAYRSGNQPLVVVISDQGSEFPNLRYQARAETVDGQVTNGNPDRTVAGALSNVKWDALS